MTLKKQEGTELVTWRSEVRMSVETPGHAHGRGGDRNTLTRVAGDKDGKPPRRVKAQGRGRGLTVGGKPK